MNERQFSRGEIVFVRDFPMGKPLKIYGKIVGFVGRDDYNVLMENGLQEGNMVTLNSWKLMSEKDAKWYFIEEQ